MHLDLYIADDPTNKDAHVSVYSLCHISLRFYAKFVPELLLIHSIIAQITQLTLIWVGGISSFPCWFSLNNSEMVKAVTLAFCSILQLCPVSRYWAKLTWGFFQFLNFWSIPYKTKFS